MNEKLSPSESMDSLDAINEYKRNNPGVNTKIVSVRKDYEIIFNDKINVVAGDYNIYFKVDIMWEEAGFNFREFGLYGYYSSTYYKITYNSNVLTIHSGNIIIEIM